MIEVKLTPEKLYAEIESLVSNHGLEYIDAILYYCEKNGLEVESVASLVKNSTKIKAKVKMEAEDLHFLPKTARLPIDG
jgi:hypothetical protein